MIPAISAGELGATSSTCHTFSPARSNEQNRMEQPIKLFSFGSECHFLLGIKLTSLKDVNVFKIYIYIYAMYLEILVLY